MTNEEFIKLVQTYFGDCNFYMGLNTFNVKVGNTSVDFYSYQRIGPNDPDASWKVGFKLNGKDININLGTTELEVKILFLNDIFKKISHISKMVEEVNTDLIKFKKEDTFLLRQYRLDHWLDYFNNKDLEDDRII